MPEWFIIALGGYILSAKMNFNIRKWLWEHYCPRPGLLSLFLSSDASGTSMGIIRDMEAKSLIIFDICSFAEVLEQPLSLVWQEISVYTELTLQLLQAFSRKKPLTRNEGTWLAFQIAYLKSLEEVLRGEIQLKKIWLDRAMFRDEGVKGISLTTSSSLENARLIAVLKTLYPGKLTDTQSEQALELIADSLLAQQMKNAVVTWLIANGVEEMEASLIARRVAIGLPGHLLAIVADNAAALPQLQKFLRLGNTRPPVIGSIYPNSGKQNQVSQFPPTIGDWIDLPREKYRADLIKAAAKPIYGEAFTLMDLYINPQGLTIAPETTATPLKPVDMKKWLLEQLEDPHTIAWIESESGGGKSSFLQMFAVHIASHLYPDLMPIIVRLRDVRLGIDLIATICSGFTADLGAQVESWLESEQFRCLVLLDGLEELPVRERQTFINQLWQFQHQSLHKFAIAAGCGEWERLEQTSNLSLKRIFIKPFAREEWRQWFQNWSKLQSLNVAQSFFNFLKIAGAFSDELTGHYLIPKLTALASQPLMLYLMAVLYRDGFLDEQLLSASSSNDKHRSEFFQWELLARLQRWLLGYPYTGGSKTVLIREGMAHIHRTPEAIAKLYDHSTPKQLYSWLQKLALQNWRSQRYTTSYNSQLTLPAFLLRNPPHQPKVVEFTHPLLEKFIAATAIANELCRQIHLPHHLHSSHIPQESESFAKSIYSLLGSNIVDIQFQEFILETLRREPQRHGSLSVLQEKLLEFWYKYQHGTWLNAGIVHAVLEDFQNLGNPSNIESIHACTGINVFFLLSTLHQETKTIFFPGGIPNTNDFNPQVVAELIARGSLIGKNIFSDRTYPDALKAVDLSHLNLSGLNLPFVHLNEVNLSNADLSNINLKGADLTGTDLSNADLNGANLSGANLNEANLIGANLTGANFTGAIFNANNLTNACLYDAILSESDREAARLKGAIFSLEDFYAIKRLLSQHELSSYASQYNGHTSMWASRISGIGTIETSEGEILCEEDEDAKGETVVHSYQQEV